MFNLEHHLFPDLNFEKNYRVVIKEVMTTALKYHHYSIIKIIKRPLKISKNADNCGHDHFCGRISNLCGHDQCGNQIVVMSTKKVVT